MRKLPCFIFTAALSVIIPSLSFSAPLVLASGAGYKKMVNALANAYSQRSGDKINLIYGNMARVIAQAKVSGKVDLLLGADWFLDKSGITFSRKKPLGQGQLVVAWSGDKAFHSDKDLTDKNIKRIAIPDPKRAIYGKAGLEYLKNTRKYNAIKGKLIEVATVPQVSSYLIAKEVDMGFLNLTHAQQIEDDIKGYLLVEKSKYNKIIIQIGEIANSPHHQAVTRFFEFLQTDTARAIITTHGL